MKAVLIFPLDGVDGEWVGTTEDGQQVVIQRMEFVPSFPRADASVAAVYTKVLDKNEQLVQRGALMVSGRKGMMFFRDRTKPVASSFDTTGAPVSKTKKKSSEQK